MHERLQGWRVSINVLRIFKWYDTIKMVLDTTQPVYKICITLHITLLKLGGTLIVKVQWQRLRDHGALLQKSECLKIGRRYFEAVFF